jgi:hypothetical protein
MVGEFGQNLVAFWLSDKRLKCRIFAPGSHGARVDSPTTARDTFGLSD